MKDTGSQAQSHEIWCDYLRCIAMSMVIALHASGLWLTGPMSSVDWRIANAVNSACRPSVPFFFMISGYLLCRSKPMSFPAYARKRITRIALAFFIATGFAIIYRIFTGEHLGVASSWEWISTPQFYHLWFFYTIVFVYVGLWIMRPNGVNPVAGTIACFAMIFILDRRGESFAAFLLYAMAGYFIGIAPRSKRTAMLFVPVGVIMLAIVYAETARISSKVGHLDQTWYRYTSTPVAAASFLLFYSMRNLLSTPPHFSHYSAHIFRISIHILRTSIFDRLFYTNSSGTYQDRSKFRDIDFGIWKRFLPYGHPLSWEDTPAITANQNHHLIPAACQKSEAEILFTLKIAT